MGESPPLRRRIVEPRATETFSVTAEPGYLWFGPPLVAGVQLERSAVRLYFGAAAA